MAPTRTRKTTQTQEIIETWEKLNSESVGQRELEAIGDVLRERFGTATPGPATIARVLADQGVPLSHPDVLDTDTRWREHRLFQIVPQDLETIEAAFVVVEKLQSLTSTINANGIDQFRFEVREIQEELKLLAQSQITNAGKRAVAAELASWLTVWLQNPSVFADWLTLRRNSPDFVQKFS